MHILEQYAVNCGAKIGKPQIIPQYFPIPFKEKYICLNAGSGMESKNYDYYNEVVEFLLPFLEKENIKIIQVGAEKEKLINNCYSALGCSKRQTAFIIKNSELYFGSDTMSLHFASYFQKKIVCLSTVIFQQNIYPYWSNKEDYTIVESHRNGNKPSFSSQEDPKTINLIKPEEPVKEILKYLKIKNDFNFKSIHLGEDFRNLKIEFVPNFPAYIDKGEDQTLNIRVDLLEDGKVSQENLQYIFANISKRKCKIYTDKEFDLTIFKHPACRKNAEEIIFFIKDSKLENKKFVENLKKSGVPCKFLFHEDIKNDESKTNDLRLEYLDYCQIHEAIKKEIPKNEKENVIENKNSLSFYKSSRIIYSNSSTYISEQGLKEKKPADSFYQKLSEIKNLDLLLKTDHNNIYIFNKK